MEKLNNKCFIVDTKKENFLQSKKILTILKIKEENLKSSFFRSKVLPKISAHILLKSVASKSLSVPREELEFSYGEKGKPSFKNFKNFYFNISHTDDAFAVFISKSEVGVDIERKKDINFKITNKFFSKKEKIIFDNSKNKTDAFFRIWTQKEAYIKYLGFGFSKTFLESDVCSKKIKTFKKNNLYVSVYNGKNEKDLKFSCVYPDAEKFKRLLEF